MYLLGSLYLSYTQSLAPLSELFQLLVWWCPPAVQHLTVHPAQEYYLHGMICMFFIVLLLLFINNVQTQQDYYIHMTIIKSCINYEMIVR